MATATQSAPKTTKSDVQPFCTVYETKNYSLFKKLLGNRGVDKMRLNALRESLGEEYLVSIIIVNEKYEIIDGQGRFEICQELRLPIRFIVVPNYGGDELRVYNRVVFKWSANDTLTSFIDLGNKHYLAYKNFRDKYDFSHQSCLAMLSGDEGITKLTGIKNVYKDGGFKVTQKNLDRATYVAEQITLLSKFDFYKDRSFHLVLLQCLRVAGFDLSKFIKKGLKHPALLTKGANHDQYLEIIENTYNYCSPNKDKISLKYSVKNHNSLNVKAAV